MARILVRSPQQKTGHAPVGAGRPTMPLVGRPDPGAGTDVSALGQPQRGRFAATERV